MKTPLVAIIGRPNVGKSSFFNAVTGKQISIVNDESGVTRDRIYANAEWSGITFSLIDTGGLDFDERGNAFSAHIKEQVDIAVDLADVIIFLTDGTIGVTAADQEIARQLRRSKKPVLLAVNKLDNQERVNENLYDFYELNMGEPFPVSCTQKNGLGDLLDVVVEKMPDAYKESQAAEDEERSEPVRIAIVGKPNAGKSSIVNRLLGEKRVMVSDVAGTTRDSIDSPFRFEGEEYILTDTAGIRRKRSVEVETVEHYSVLRALSAIRNSDVCVLVIDATEGISEQDVRLAGYIDEMGKPSVITVNKWDIATSDKPKEEYFKDFNKMLERDLAFMPYFKAIFISALTGQRIGEIMKAVVQVMTNTKSRITTGTLNNLITQFVATTPPPSSGGKRPKFKYATQVSICPPAFALFVNEREIVASTYLRYLENCLRKSVELTGTPIRLLLRSGKHKDEN
jgi:GTP-binding protein